MTRHEWLAGVRATTRDRYDRLHSPKYDEHGNEIGDTHRRFVTTIVEAAPRRGVILDAACGTGKYFALVMGADRSVVGVDQSAGMLTQAHRKFPGVRLERAALQELAFDRAFDAVMCIDAMENVPPEDWPIVVANLRTAARPGGRVYLTVEKPDASELAESMRVAREAGLPIVDGEDFTPTGGYDYYPGLEQVLGWLDGAGLELLEQADDAMYYWHFLTRRPP